jgi:hypothetical protein
MGRTAIPSVPLKSFAWSSRESFCLIEMPGAQWWLGVHLWGRSSGVCGRSSRSSGRRSRGDGCSRRTHSSVTCGDNSGSSGSRRGQCRLHRGWHPCGAPACPGCCMQAPLLKLCSLARCLSMSRILPTCALFNPSTPPLQRSTPAPGPGPHPCGPAQVQPASASKITECQARTWHILACCMRRPCVVKAISSSLLGPKAWNQVGSSTARTQLQASNAGASPSVQ